LLRQHGAIEDLPQLDRIEIRRAGKNVPGLFKGTNNLNQFTLFELLAVHYGFVSANPQPVPAGRNSASTRVFESTSMTLQSSLAFPDLANATIHRATPDGRGRSDMKIDLSSRLAASPNCQDFPLQWGDVLEIPELDHPIDAKWGGFSVENLARLKECLKRTVHILVKGEMKRVTLLPEADAGDARLNGSFNRVSPQFTLLPVLNQSGMLRASSDLTRVKVRRRDSATGQSYEMILDCSQPNAPPDLWLRDGDVIEVPEKT
jgi:hypothetical protein